MNPRPKLIEACFCISCHELF